MARSNVNDIITELPPTAISFDVQAFDDAIRSQGTRFYHYSALRCPVGMVNIDDLQRPHPDHEGCTNGFLYSKVGALTGLFTGNNKHKNAVEMGFYDGSTVQVTFPRHYDDCEKKVYIAPFDRFFLDESIVEPTWQLFVHHESGVDRLKYPVEQVLSLTDSSGLEYTEGQDFKVKNGQIHWLDRRPSPFIDLGSPFAHNATRGAVCSVRYVYKPFFYVGQLLHSIRVSQVSNGADRQIERMPQSALLHREYVSLTKDQNPNASSSIDADTLRTVLGSSSGSFGNR